MQKVPRTVAGSRRAASRAVRRVDIDVVAVICTRSRLNHHRARLSDIFGASLFESERKRRESTSTSPGGPGGAPPTPHSIGPELEAFLQLRNRWDRSQRHPSSSACFFFKSHVTARISHPMYSLLHAIFIVYKHLGFTICPSSPTQPLSPTCPTTSTFKSPTYAFLSVLRHAIIHPITAFCQQTIGSFRR